MKPISFRTPDYKNLVCYQKAEAVYDITSLFCSRYLSTKDRTYDQMIQAARSGKQNIAEGQAAMPTSMESCLKLINVAKASLHELLADYEDYLRTHELKRWDENTPEFRQIVNWDAHTTMLLFIVRWQSNTMQSKLPIWL